jgi:hypothetical protein
MRHLIRALIIGTLGYMLAGCGEFRIEVDDVLVNHRVDTSNLIKYFEARCREENPTYNSAQINACAQSDVADFLTSFNLGG